MTRAPVAVKKREFMIIASKIAAGLLAAMHLYISVIEIFFWTTVGQRSFGFTPEFALSTRAIAANQGLYNAFLAGGLVFGLWLGAEGTKVLLFFASCVVLAGVFGAATVNHRILLSQALPGAITFVLVLLRRVR